MTALIVLAAIMLVAVALASLDAWRDRVIAEQNERTRAEGEQATQERDTRACQTSNLDTSAAWLEGNLTCAMHSWQFRIFDLGDKSMNWDGAPMPARDAARQSQSFAPYKDSRYTIEAPWGGASILSISRRPAEAANASSTAKSCRKCN